MPRVEEAGHVQIGPIHPCIGGKAIGRCRVKSPDGRDCFVPDLHCDIDDTFDTAFVHHLQDRRWILRIEMVVVIDHGKLRPLRVVHGRVQHGAE